MPKACIAIRAAISGTVVSVDVQVGDAVQRGQQVAVMEAMKMEHVVVSTASGVVREIRVAADQTLVEGTALLTLDVLEDAGGLVAFARSTDPDQIRAGSGRVARAARADIRLGTTGRSRQTA